MLHSNPSISRLLKGFFIGIGSILPGVSGGVMAVSMGVYEPMLESVLHFFRNPKKNFLYLLPLAGGILAGILLASNALFYLFRRWEVPLLFVFIGLVVGGIPSIVQQANQTHGFHSKYLLFTVLGAGILLLFAFLERSLFPQSQQLTPLVAILCGAIIALGTIVPGVSMSFLLLYLGYYESVLAAIGSVDLLLLGCMTGGFAASAWLIMKLIQLSFARYPSQTHYSILGFLLASIVLVIPPISPDSSLLAYAALLAAGILVSQLLLRLGSEKKAK